jgi:hypothetical protein
MTNEPVIFRAPTLRVPSKYVWNLFARVRYYHEWIMECTPPVSELRFIERTKLYETDEWFEMTEKGLRFLKAMAFPGYRPRRADSQLAREEYYRRKHGDDYKERFRERNKLLQHKRGNLT